MQATRPVADDGGRRVRVWSAPLRISHWLLASAVLVLLATGWLVRASAELSQAALDYHFLAAYVLVAALLLRAYLLWFGRATDGWRDLWPGSAQAPAQWRLAVAVLMAYASGGARPMPYWFGHNPLWGPVYLVWYAVLVLAAWSGWSRHAGVDFWPGLHHGLAQLIGIVLVLHLVAVLIHELRCEHGEVSAMINGHKWFRRRQPVAEVADATPGTVRVELRGRVDSG